MLLRTQVIRRSMKNCFFGGLAQLTSPPIFDMLLILFSTGKNKYYTAKQFQISQGMLSATIINHTSFDVINMI